MSFNKLVRDRIPDIIKESGHTPYYRIMNDDEYWNELVKKLQEEVDEFVESGNIEELADILEVVYSIALTKKITKEELENIREEKKNERGSFDNKIFLIKKD